MHKFKCEIENQEIYLLWVSVSSSPSHPTTLQRFTDSAACWSVDQVAPSLWLRH